MRRLAGRRHALRLAGSSCDGALQARPSKAHGVRPHFCDRPDTRGDAARAAATALSGCGIVTMLSSEQGGELVLSEGCSEVASQGPRAGTASLLPPVGSLPLSSPPFPLSLPLDNAELPF